MGPRGWQCRPPALINEGGAFFYFLKRERGLSDPSCNRNEDNVTQKEGGGPQGKITLLNDPCFSRVVGNDLLQCIGNR